MPDYSFLSAVALVDVYKKKKIISEQNGKSSKIQIRNKIDK